MAIVHIQDQSPSRDTIVIQFMIFGANLEDVINTVKSFGHRWESEPAETEMIEVQIMGSNQSHKMAGRQKPATVTVYNEDDALLLKLKYSDQLIEGYRTKIYITNEECDD